MFRIIWYRTKTLNVLSQMFAYEPNLKGPQRTTFNGVTKQIRSIKGNEYDAAIAFMLTQLAVGSGLSGGNDDRKRFRQKLLTDATYCSNHAVLKLTKETVNGLFNDMMDNEDTGSY